MPLFVFINLLTNGRYDLIAALRYVRRTMDTIIHAVMDITIQTAMHMAMFTSVHTAIHTIIHTC